MQPADGGIPMTKHSMAILAALGVAGLVVSAGSATANDGKHQRHEVHRAFLVGVSETPSVSTPASGRFRAVIDEDSGLITFTLSYRDLTAAPLFAHIHFGERHTAGGVMVFLCGGGGQPACPASPAEITGSITAENVLGPEPQGIAPGEFDEVLRAIRSGASYANVHTPTFPAGEIRGQLSR
jgi:hypothetical protein